MPIGLMDIYNRLPAPGRNIAASIRGFYLRSWRYGPETDQLVAEAHEREHWSQAQWTTYRENRLAFILHRAATRVPYYREQWAERRRRGDHASWDYLENWPILPKEPVRQNPKAFIADDCDIRQMFPEHTSGTTNKSLKLWWSRDMVRQWYALFEARWRNWYGVTRHDRWAMLGGQLITPIEQRHPPFWVWNAGFNQLYMSSYHLAPDLIPSYLDAIASYKIKYLYGYSSTLYALAQEAVRLKRRDLRMVVAIANAEPLFQYQRDMIAEAFQSPSRETYGMAEAVAAASECEAGTLHLWPEIGWIEVDLQGDPPGSAGNLICTGLLNVNMPFIRYQVGDRAALPVSDTPCRCGRTLPRIAYIEGRLEDVLYTADGRRIVQPDLARDTLPITEAQMIQETLERIRVRYVPAAGFNATTAEPEMAERVRSFMGDIQVVFEALPQIPRTSNGKFRVVICALSPEEREHALEASRHRTVNRRSLS